MNTYRITKIARGAYNYRGYEILFYGPCRWVIHNEYDGVAAETKTLREMVRLCDEWERQLSSTQMTAKQFVNTVSNQP